jgi:hypothetical protein
MRWRNKMNDKTFYRVVGMVLVQFVTFILMMFVLNDIEIPQDTFEYYMMSTMNLLVSFVAGIFVGIAAGYENS